MTSRGRVLVVDDSALVRREVERVLLTGGDPPLACQKGKEDVNDVAPLLYPPELRGLPSGSPYAEDCVCWVI